MAGYRYEVKNHRHTEVYHYGSKGREWMMLTGYFAVGILGVLDVVYSHLGSSRF